MATSFPTGSDNFTIPSSPGTTALSSAGTGSRNHVQHHRDLGDTIEAMQAEATLAAHSHDSSTARHGNKLTQANTHESPDTDVAAGSLHHTLGHGATQVAPGDHASLLAFQDTHANTVAWPVGSVYISTSATNPSAALGGTWVQVQNAFLVGVGGSYSYTGSVVNNTSTHSHTVANTSSNGSHTHVVGGDGTTFSAGAHVHSASNTGGSNVPHTHGTLGTGFATSFGAAADGDVTAGSSEGTHLHSHSMGGSASYSSGESNHTHSVGDYNSSSTHFHNIDDVSGSSHSHTVTSSSTAHLPTWKSFYVWRRTV